MEIFVARYNDSPSIVVEEPEKRILRCLISQKLDPSNKDIALGMTEMAPGGKSDVRGHEEGELFLCLEGKGTVIIDNKRIILEKYDAVYVPPNHIHSLEADCDSTFNLAWILTPPFGGDIKVYNMANNK